MEYAWGYHSMLAKQELVCYLLPTMAHKQAAFKAIRQSAKRTERNRSRIRAVKELTRVSLDAIKQSEQDALKKVLLAAKAIDKAVQKGTLHPNTGARKKSRLMKRFNAALGKK